MRTKNHSSVRTGGTVVIAYRKNRPGWAPDQSFEFSIEEYKEVLGSEIGNHTVLAARKLSTTREAAVTAKCSFCSRDANTCRPKTDPWTKKKVLLCYKCRGNLRQLEESHCL